MSGISLHIGLNRIDPSHYGTEGRLRGCESDARDMKDIADERGFDSRILLSAQATVSNTVQGIADAASALNSGDIFFLSYSGHGGQVNDSNGDEPDRKDETWCLFDRQLIDDELFTLWGAFKPGVRIIILSDSCHSGTVIRALKFRPLLASILSAANQTDPFFGIRTLPRGRLEEVYLRHKDMYDLIQAQNPQGNRAFIRASIILISGCQDWQLSADLPTNGLFTQTLKEVWNGGTFAGNYLEFHQAISDRMPGDQSPNYFKQGVPNANFDSQSPFEI